MIFIARLVLILTLIAGSVQMAPMRGQMAGVSQIEVCSGSGVALVTLDARGTPVDAAHSCPDCIASVTAGLLPETGGALLPRAAVPMAHPWAQVPSPAGIIPVGASARGPPVFV